jgi:hypothetical protein
MLPKEVLFFLSNYRRSDHDLSGIFIPKEAAASPRT